MQNSKMLAMMGISQEYIPEEFRQQINLHICKNIISNKSHDFKCPLILSISGPSGMGKTYQTKLILNETKIKYFQLSATEFEHAKANVPIKMFTDLYDSASQSIIFKETPISVIFIDDVDTALGTWGNNAQYTMNRQHFIKALIDIADNPYKLVVVNEMEEREERDTLRVPIIMTLNDETKMYPPLMRPGRTKIFKWKISRDDSMPIIRTILKGLSLKEAEYIYDQLYKKAQETDNILYKHGLPISIFSEIKNDLLDKRLINSINKVGVISTANNFDMLSYQNDINELVKIGERHINKIDTYL